MGKQRSQQYSDSYVAEWMNTWQSLCNSLSYHAPDPNHHDVNFASMLYSYVVSLLVAYFYSIHSLNFSLQPCMKPTHKLVQTRLQITKKSITNHQIKCKSQNQMQIVKSNKYPHKTTNQITNLFDSCRSLWLMSDPSPVSDLLGLTNFWLRNTSTVC